MKNNHIFSNNLSTSKEGTKGFSLVKLLIVLVIIIVFVSLLGYNLEQDIVQNPQVQNNFSFVLSWISSVWDNHLATPALYIWNDIIIDIFWNQFLTQIISGDFVNEINSVADTL